MDDKARVKALRERLQKRETQYRRELAEVREEMTRLQARLASLLANWTREGT